MQAHHKSKTQNDIPKWFYNDLCQVGVDFEALDQVAAFDRNQRSSTPEAEQALVTRLGISKGDTVIDLGAGTGTFAIAAASVGAYVHAVDVSQAMLTYAQQKANNANATNLEFHHGGFLTYQHKGNLADFIVTKAALHHLPDFWKMAAFIRMAAMLKDGGILFLRDVIFSFEAAEYQSQINAWIQRSAKPVGEGFTVDDYETHIREEHSTFAWIIEGMLQKAGFTILEANYLSTASAEYICKKSIVGS